MRRGTDTVEGARPVLIGIDIGQSALKVTAGWRDPWLDGRRAAYRVSGARLGRARSPVLAGGDRARL
jgi:hypothetical protein